ncbi:hypothetical protein VTL71DRAFT_152 [Oculimacula yallundae]|uniref:Sorbitol dehydrogenase n=1 Tax=Oculimacula yallundae TaxID=86028 RepID=A0ABR4CZF3_9HELO
MSTETRMIQASCLHGVRDIKIEERPLKAPSPDELQIAIQSTGICGSDQHYYNHFANGDILVKEPLSLGHESSGIVTSIGSMVETSDFQIGDRVALEVGKPCESCGLCKEGRYNICPKMSFRSSAKSFPHYQGTLQEAINAPAKWCHKLPANVSTELGALLEPLSVAIHGVRRANLSPGSATLVIGSGAVGLLSAAMLQVIASSKVVVICDIDARRVDFATENGFADHGFTVPMKRGASIEEKLEIARETAGLAIKASGCGEDFVGFDAVFECTGVEACMQTAIYTNLLVTKSSRPGGKVIMIGMGNPIQTLPLSAAALREVDLVGVFRYANTYPYGISILAGEEQGSGRSLPDLTKLITHRFIGLNSITQAFEMAGKGIDEKGNLVLKVLINNEEFNNSEV